MHKDNNDYRILVIEDNAGDFVLIEDFLFEQIHAPKICHAPTFQSSKKLLTDSSHKFDIVLLDLSLPDLDGEQLINEIIALIDCTPVIVLTGYADVAFGLRSLSMGVSDYLLKDELTASSLYKSIIYSAERKKNYAALEESEDKYSKLFHFSPLPMWVIDIDTKRFLDVNQSTIAHYGYTYEEFLTMSLKDIRPKKEIANLEDAFIKDKTKPAEHSQHVMVHLLKNGSIRNVEIQIAPILFKGQKANIVIANDITERLKYINAIEEQNKKFKEISWIQSHVIRAPLARIMGIVSLIQSNDETPEERAIMLQLLMDSAKEMDEVITTITNKTKDGDYQLPNASSE